jgi:UDP-glucose 6-dehydrogenase
VILTEWREFKELQDSVLISVKDKNIFDGRNLLDRTKLGNLGINYYCIGKK